MDPVYTGYQPKLSDGPVWESAVRFVRAPLSGAMADNRPISHVQSSLRYTTSSEGPDSVSVALPAAGSDHPDSGPNQAFIANEGSECGDGELTALSRVFDEVSAVAQAPCGSDSA